MAEDFFDVWAESVRIAMVEKGHGFLIEDESHAVALLVLVASEVHEAIHVVKKRYLEGVNDIGEELADALIRMGHFAATAGISIGDTLPFETFNALGRSRAEMFVAFGYGQWAMIARLGRLAGQAHDVAEAWQGQSTFTTKRAFCSLFAMIAGAAVALGINLDQAIDDKMLVNHKRPYRFGVAANAT